MNTHHYTRSAPKFVSSNNPAYIRAARNLRLDVHGRIKPLLRGWIHLVSAPLVLAAGIVLICLARNIGLVWSCVVFVVSSVLLFTHSAVYHLGNWSSRTTDVLRRIDHANIFLLIAGTYTPIVFVTVPVWRSLVIGVIWVCTIVVLLIHVVWINAPRWLYVSLYAVLGVAGVGFMGVLWNSCALGPAIVMVILSGGICYLFGALVYGLRWFDFFPRVFGFHEVFHVLSLAGFVCQLVGVYMLVVCG